MRHTACAIAALTITAAANAGTVSWYDFAEGLEVQNVVKDSVNINLVADPHGVIYENPKQGGLGVHQGGANSEIGSADFLHFTFSEAVYINAIKVNKLYAAGYLGDSQNEGVKIQTNLGTFFFYAQDVDKGDVVYLPDLDADLRAINAPNDSGTGMWVLESDEPLFGGAIKWMRFSADPQFVGPSGADYSIMAIKFTRDGKPPIPAPGAAALLGAGGLMTLRRRRR